MLFHILVRINSCIYKDGQYIKSRKEIFKIYFFQNIFNNTIGFILEYINESNFSSLFIIIMFSIRMH